MPLLRARELATSSRRRRSALRSATRVSPTNWKRRRARARAEGDRALRRRRAADAWRRWPPPPRRPSRHLTARRDDVCLIGFTSGTTGVPKGTMHFHRDMLAICDGYSRHLLRAGADDVFIGSPPIAFTFGLGGLVLFPMRVGASTVLLEKASPADLLAGIERSAPPSASPRPPLTAPCSRCWRAATSPACAAASRPARRCRARPSRPGRRRPASPSSTASARPKCCTSSSARAARTSAPGATGKPVPGYEARVHRRDGQRSARGTLGRLAVRGPTGCRYLADDAPGATTCKDGWNVTGDTYIRDADGYFWYQARADDMIISAGYNIAGPEVEAALLAHPAVGNAGSSAPRTRSAARSSRPTSSSPTASCRTRRW